MISADRSAKVCGVIIGDIGRYDGKLLGERFAYRYFQDKTLAIGNIVGFRAPVEIDKSRIYDMALASSVDSLSMEDAVNFCWEVPYIRDMYSAAAFSRLLNSGIASLLSASLGAPSEVDGSAVWILKGHEQGGAPQTKGRPLVSFFTMASGHGVGYIGLCNRGGRKTPAYMFDCSFDQEAIVNMCKEIIRAFYHLAQGLHVDAAKTTTP